LKEVWKDINGYGGYYQISNKGRVKSLSRKRLGKPFRNGTKGIANVRQRILNPNITKLGYIHYVLQKNAKSLTVKAHRLVAQAFILNPQNKPHINHVDFNKQNNCVHNLEWVTQSENERHTIKNGIKKSTRGNKYLGSYQKRLNPTIVKSIKRLSRYHQTNELCSMFGLSRFVVRDLLRGRSYKNVE